MPLALKANQESRYGHVIMGRYQFRNWIMPISSYYPTSTMLSVDRSAILFTTCDLIRVTRALAKLVMTERIGRHPILLLAN